MKRLRLLAPLVFPIVLVLAGCGSGSPRFVSREPAVAGASRGEAELNGYASYYAEEFNGRPTASGEIYDMHKLTAAHRTLPFNTIVKVYNLDNGRSIQVRINDRGPFKEDRVIDLSLEGAKQLGIIPLGTAPVRLQIIEMGSK